MASSSLIKWQITIFSVAIFLLVSSPSVYGLTHSLFKDILGPIMGSTGLTPTAVGFALHTLIYALIVRYSMDLDLFRD
jgi:hypothetical protein